MNGVRPLNRALATVLALLLTFSGCKSNKESAEAPPAAQGGAATAAVTQASWAPDALEELVAPIALYPDQLVGQILAASVNTQEVLDAGNWLLQNQDLKGDALDAASEKVGFGAATRGLLHFPTVVDMMCQELDWTKQLGAAFTSDQKGVLDAIQRLRTSALNVGTLKSGPQQTVETTTQNGQQVVEVKPTNPQVVYVPQYDPAVVYTAPPQQTTTVIQEDDDDDAALAGLLGFGVGIMVGAAISNSYCYPSWGYGAVYMGPRPFYPPAYVYRPVYGGAYRPAYGYHPPHNYGNNYHRGNTNINIENNYYGRFSNNNNLKRGNANSPIGNNRAGVSDNRARTNDRGGRNQASTRPSGGSAWKGQSGYAGAKPGGSKQVRDSQARVASNNKASQRPAADRGYGGSDRPSASTRQTASASNRASTSSRPAATTARTASTDSRIGSGSGSTRSQVDAGTGANVLRSSGSDRASSSSRSGALSGASQRGSGSFDRAASARGSASTRSSSSSRGGGGGGGFRR